MDKKVTGIVAYITWIGLLIAFLAGDREGAKFHLNQALVITLAGIALGIIGWLPIPFIGVVIWIAQIVLFVFAIMGLISAVKEEEKELPLIGGIKILK